MIPQKPLRVILLSLSLLLFSSLATGAAIPPPSIRVYEYESETHQSTLKAASLSRPIANTIAKGRPYYFPETVPDDSEIAERLTALREAGLVSSSQRQHVQNSIGSSSPDTEIDTRARTSRVSRFGSAESRNATIFAVPLSLFVFASSVVCVATIISRMRAPR